MDRETARAALKTRLPEYVRQITSLDRKAGRNMYKCPLCASGNGAHRTGAFSIKSDNLTWHCFSCGKGGDIFDLIGEYENIADHNAQLKRACELFNITIDGTRAPDPRDRAQKRTEKGKIADEMTQEEKKPQPGQFELYIKQCAANAEKTDYFLTRGLTPETVARFNLGYDEAKNAIVIPYDRSNSYYITRSTQGKEFRKPPADKAGTEPVYNSAALYGDQPCFICESPIDAISIMQAGGTAAAIGGTGSQKLLEQVKTKAPSSPLILCFDNDTAGKRATEAAAAALKEAGITFVIARFSLDEYSGTKKDANDLLRANEEQLQQDIRQNVKAAIRKSGFTSYNVSNYLSNGSYEADIDYFKQYQYRKTGFSNIDKYLTLYPGLAALGGSASLGKSTFAINLADNLVRLCGETVLYFALEQEPIELITKSIARMLYDADPNTTITNTDIKNGAKSEILDAIKTTYAEMIKGRFEIIRCNFTMTAEDIRDYVESYISKTGKKPVVFIDYLQLISPPEGFRGDTRAATDHVIKLFKTMQRDNELFVCLISNFNRNSYAVPVSYEAFKETGMIEFTCDYVWGLQLSVLEDDTFYSKEGKNGGEKETGIKAKRDAIFEASAKNPKEVEFVSLKSRNGKQVYKCFFKYNMPFDTFIPDLNSPHDTSSPTAAFTQLSIEEDKGNPFTGQPEDMPIV